MEAGAAYNVGAAGAEIWDCFGGEAAFCGEGCLAYWG